jgi:tetratricopeptide (TPR) repeat protein
MKIQSVVIVTGLSAWMWVASATAATVGDSGIAVAEKPLDSLIQNLSDANFRTREEASRKIWQIGDPALPELEKAAKGNDPEAAYRARELIRKIQLQITPETDPAVTQLVERYQKAPLEEKVIIFDKLNRKRAWRQILKLFASETDGETQFRIQGPLRGNQNGDGYGVAGVAVIAAREELIKGDVNGAREFLEMAPATATGLLALADFHRSQGTWDAELKRAKTLKGASADAWQLALYRATGNLDAAKNAATAAGETRISALMSVLNGDPVPWLEMGPLNGADEPTLKPYADLAIRRWQGKPVRSVDLYPLMLSVNSKNGSERLSGVTSLFLLGESAAAEPIFAKTSPMEAFSYFETLERVPEALKILGMDPANPDYTGWVAKRFETLVNGNEDEDDTSTPTQELIIMADFLERRGLKQQSKDAFLKPLAAFAEKDEKNFTQFLGHLFQANLRRKSLGAPLVASEAAAVWAGDNPSRWDDILDAVFGQGAEAKDLWEWMADLDPDATRADRLAGMLALYDIGSDPHRLREKWLQVGWEEVRKTPLEQRQQVLGKMTMLVQVHADVAANLRLWDQLPAASRKDNMMQTHRISDLLAAGRWAECADIFLQQIDLRSQMKLEPQPSAYACAATCLRKAGRIEEADTYDAWVDKLALGNDAAIIAAVYASYGDDYRRSSEWWARAARQCNPDDFDVVAGAFEANAVNLMEDGKWKEVAAVSEVLAQMAASRTTGNFSPIDALGLRLKADLGRALANLKEDRAGSIAILENCPKMFPSDGSLADDFFPSLRKAGLMKEHDEWFDRSWQRMMAVVAQYPDSDNTYNTAAWLASRARRNLDQAEKLQEKALAAKPDESSYLDTMAEIQFAKGNRKKALEWSALAVNFSPDSMQPLLRRQYERFRSSPLPR